ncbi:MAG: hypothetical protein U0V03_09515 [Bacteroidia bacterium]
MKKFIPILLLFIGCQNHTVDKTKTIKTLTEAIDLLLKRKTEHIEYYLNVKDNSLNQLIVSSNELKSILGDSTGVNVNYHDVERLFNLKFPKLIQYDNWTKEIDTSLTGIDLKINILANHLSFLNRTLDIIERRNEYSFKDIKILSTDNGNYCKVYLTTKLRSPYIQFLFDNEINDSLQFTGGIKDTNRIVAREFTDHFTIINKDGKNYRYVLKFAKANGTFEYFTVK